MNPKKWPSILIVSLLITAILISSCSSTTLLQTTPSFASVYVEGQEVGTTPYNYSDRKAAGASTMIVFRKQGYTDSYVNLKRNERLDVGALIAGIWLLVPLFWLKKYDSVHTYELKKNTDDSPILSAPDNSHYLKGEDERVIIRVDSLIRANSLPDYLKWDIKLVEESEYITSLYTGLRNGNEYIFIYYSVVEKVSLNISYNDDALTNMSIKDEFGNPHTVMLRRGSNRLYYPGGSTSWNPERPIYEGQIIESEYLVFQMPKNVTPLQLKYVYFYKPPSPYRGQRMWSQIDIDLVPRNEY